MNKLKTNARILLIILIAAFIVIPIAAVLVSKVFGIHEGMDSYDMTGKNGSMDRINMEGVSFKNSNGDEATGAPGDYLYCIGGEITCADSGDTLVEDTNGGTYTDDNKSHNSYNSFCVNNNNEKNSNTVCTNHVSETSDNNTISFFDSTNNETTLSGPSNEEFKGFLGPYNYIPMKISDNYVYLHDSSDSFSACYLYGDCTETETATTETATANEDNKKKKYHFKCLADNGAKPGDPLCCGQDGVLQNTKYNCPSEYPHCIGYKCGETWGKCSTTSEK